MYWEVAAIFVDEFDPLLKMLWQVSATLLKFRDMSKLHVDVNCIPISKSVLMSNLPNLCIYMLM